MESLANDQKDTGAQKKKLKQALLSFYTTPKTYEEGRKRKLSENNDNDDTDKKSKISRVEVSDVNENNTFETEQDLNPKSVDIENVTNEASIPDPISSFSGFEGDENELNVTSESLEPMDTTLELDLSTSTDLDSSTLSVQTPEDKSKKLSAKKLSKIHENEAKRKEKEKQKEEKERKKAEEREEKLKQKAEKEEQRRLEKEMKEKKRLLELQLKSEEKRLKEEERKAKEEEKKQKEEAKLLKEAKTKAVFTKFFVTKQKHDEKKMIDENESSRFMPFEVKKDMRLASAIRTTLDKESKEMLDKYVKESDVQPTDLYLKNLKGKCMGKSENKPKIVSNENGVEKCKKRWKLLQFEENRRPAYWGTWRKKSKFVKPRKPLSKDEELLDYDFDSDLEWIEEEPGESVQKSDDEQEPDDDYEIDDDVFVPHGYLSEEEMQDDETSPTKLKDMLKNMETEFLAEIKEKTKKLIPTCIGCTWIDNEVDKSDNPSENYLLQFRAIYGKDDIPFIMPKIDLTNQTLSSGSKGKLTTTFPELYVGDLIKLVHGSKKSSRFMAKEFSSYVSKMDNTINLTMACITRKIKELSTWMLAPEHNQTAKIYCWFVKEDIRAKYELSELNHLDNKWEYVTVDEGKLLKSSEKDNNQTNTNQPKSSVKNCLITKFAKVINKLAEQPITICEENKTIIKNNKKYATLITIKKPEKDPIPATPSTIEKSEHEPIFPTPSVFKKPEREPIVPTPSMFKTPERELIAPLKSAFSTPSDDEKPDKPSGIIDTTIPNVLARFARLQKQPESKIEVDDDNNANVECKKEPKVVVVPVNNETYSVKNNKKYAKLITIKSDSKELVKEGHGNRGTNEKKCVSNSVEGKTEQPVRKRITPITISSPKVKKANL